MTCPGCSTEMRAGTVNVAPATINGIVEFVRIFAGEQGCSQQYLYFYPAGGDDSVCVFDGRANAFRCPNCQMVVIAAPAQAVSDESISR